MTIALMAMSPIETNCDPGGRPVLVLREGAGSKNYSAQQDHGTRRGELRQRESDVLYPPHSMSSFIISSLYYRTGKDSPLRSRCIPARWYCRCFYTVREDEAVRLCVDPYLTWQIALRVQRCFGVISLLLLYAVLKERRRLCHGDGSWRFRRTLPVERSPKVVLKCRNRGNVCT